MGGDGLAGAVAGELRESDGVMAVLPGGRGNDLRAQARDRQRPGRGDRHPRGRPGAPDRRRRGRRVDLRRHPQRRPGLRRAGGRQRHPAEAARAARLPLRHAASRCGAGGRRSWEVDDRRRAPRVPRLRGGGGQLRRLRRAACGWSPTPRSTTACSTSPSRSTRRSGTYLRGLTKVFSGAHVDEPGFEIHRGREVVFRADRPFTAYADGDPIADLPGHGPDRARGAAGDRAVRLQAGLLAARAAAAATRVGRAAAARRCRARC